MYRLCLTTKYGRLNLNQAASPQNPVLCMLITTRYEEGIFRECFVDVTDMLCYNKQKHRSSNGNSF